MVRKTRFWKPWHLNSSRKDSGANSWLLGKCCQRVCCCKDKPSFSCNSGCRIGLMGSLVLPLPTKGDPTSHPQLGGTLPSLPVRESKVTTNTATIWSSSTCAGSCSWSRLPRPADPGSPLPALLHVEEEEEERQPPQPPGSPGSGKETAGPSAQKRSGASSACSTMAGQLRRAEVKGGAWAASAIARSPPPPSPAAWLGSPRPSREGEIHRPGLEKDSRRSDPLCARMQAWANLKGGARASAWLIGKA